MITIVNKLKKNVKDNEISLFLAESPVFIHGSPDFPLSGVGRSEFVTV